jgi:hypothetical protein
MAQKPHKTP